MQFTVDGQEHEVDLLKHSYRLGVASAEQRENVKIKARGAALHWPDPDEGILVDILIGKVKMLPHETRAAWEEYASM